MLRTRIRASNVTLMGCASGSQSHAAGDEPLGITTALLCAGASSMTGTMWKADVDTALAFTDRFLATLAKERRDAQAGVVDLARVVQKARNGCKQSRRDADLATYRTISSCADLAARVCSCHDICVSVPQLLAPALNNNYAPRCCCTSSAPSR
ncbi:tetratricopeptide repeat protein [Botryosphaeria dothidea]|uniref:Tetratricopeptide repeat protein n=1 Tax=Botryosphaeria dothidea TaxID=55169 RepID=A0A8H4IZ07_9PEZI|nr:tetratricopeptide repeat protein [Botryosphaeria dothidea]